MMSRVNFRSNAGGVRPRAGSSIENGVLLIKNWESSSKAMGQQNVAMQPPFPQLLSKYMLKGRGLQRMGFNLILTSSLPHLHPYSSPSPPPPPHLEVHVLPIPTFTSTATLTSTLDPKPFLLFLSTPVYRLRQRSSSIMGPSAG